LPQRAKRYKPQNRYQHIFNSLMRAATASGTHISRKINKLRVLMLVGMAILGCECLASLRAPN
jgi:hypothetical protein